jgi:Domain of unknown function (DUF4159)
VTRKLSVVLVLLSVLVSLAVGQYYRGDRGYGRRSRGDVERPDDPNRDRKGVPNWDKDQEFKHDVFTFVRVEYSSWGGYGGRGGRWQTDYPDSDLNFSYRLQELTSLKVDPNGKVLKLTDPQLLDYPFIYIIEPGNMDLEEAEVLGLRKYLENGGFLMVDDFWGEDEWFVFYEQIKRVFPNREPKELPLDHEIFHCVYDLKEKPQIPSINHYWSGRKTERWDATEAHYRAIFDDNDRIMALICHNTDLGDGWEREGLDQGYFKEYSEKWAYPLGINIVTYAMTH